MPERYPLTVHVPVNGQVFIRLDGVPGEHEVGTFTQNIPVQFAAGPGEVAFTFDKAFWEAAIKNKRGVEPPTPTDKPSPSEAFDLTKDIVVAVLKSYVDYQRLPVDQVADDIAVALRDRGLT